MYKSQYTQKKFNNIAAYFFCWFDPYPFPSFEFCFPSGADAGTAARVTWLISPIVFPWCFLICHCSHNAGDMTEFPGKAELFVSWAESCTSSMLPHCICVNHGYKWNICRQLLLHEALHECSLVLLELVWLHALLWFPPCVLQAILISLCFPVVLIFKQIQPPNNVCSG